MQGGLPIAYGITEFKPDVGTIYILCKTDQETLVHLVFEYTYTQTLWYSIVDLLNLSNNAANVQQQENWLSEQRGRGKLRDAYCLLCMQLPYVTFGLRGITTAFIRKNNQCIRWSRLSLEVCSKFDYVAREGSKLARWRELLHWFVQFYSDVMSYVLIGSFCWSNSWLLDRDGVVRQNMDESSAKLQLFLALQRSHSPYLLVLLREPSDHLV